MAYNKVILKENGTSRTLIDLSSDTVDSDKALSGISFHKKNGEQIAGSIPSLGAQTIVPSLEAQIIPSGKYLSGNQTVSAITKELLTSLDTDFVAGNIKKDVSLFGLTGTFEGSGGGGEKFEELVDGTISVASGSASTIRPYAFASCSSLTTATFTNCTSIDTYAFASCSRLATVSFPVCTSIGASAFYYCSNLTAVSFPSCTTIDKYAFFSCSRLTTASFPVCISIDQSAFRFCNSLITASFPVCTSVGDAAFQQCFSITTASFPVCTIIGNYAFQSCKSLTTEYFPVCTTIGNYAFQSCYGLASATFPLCISIGSSAFNGCSSLITASFPVCTKIDVYAFRSCYRLTSLYLLGSSVPILSNVNALSSTPISNYTTSTGGVYGSIIVQASMLDVFKSAPNWSVYSSRFSVWNGTD